MATLAIEGHKKLESAQQELLDAFSACFRKVNGRSIDTWQPHEMVCLCSDACFCDLIEHIRCELETLSGEKTAPVADLSRVMALCQARALHLEGDLTAEALADTLFRTQILGELLVDLQCCRMVAKKVCTTELHLELSDKVNQESKTLISEIAKALGVEASERSGKGAYKGKGKAAAATASSGGDEKVQALEQIAQVVAADEGLCNSQHEHLLYPAWSLSPAQERSVKDLISMFNKEYTTRRKVLTRRLDVTIQAFLWSAKADDYMEQISQAIAAIMDWRDHLGSANIGLWHMFAMDQAACHDPGKVSSINALKSVVKTVIIGAVPDRGGVPEGYTVEDIAKDIVKANVALTRKDQGGGRGQGASAQAAAAMASKRWLGKGMGSGDAYGAGSGDSKGGGGAGGAYYSKGGGGKGGKGGGDGGGGGGRGGGYYSQSGGGGSKGGGYYSQHSDGGGGKGGGGRGKGGGGGGFYAQQHDAGGGYPGGGGGGGFYAQQQQQQATGGYYAQQEQQAVGGGGFYAQQAAGGAGGGGGFYAQQGGGGGGGFYAQQGVQGGGGGFYDQGGGGGGGGGFYAQQGGGGGGGGFYAQQGGGGGGFYDQGGGGRGRGGKGKGGGGWGGRDADLPPTAKGWSKGGR